MVMEMVGGGLKKNLCLKSRLAGISLNSFPESDISIRPQHSQPVSFLVRFLLIQKMNMEAHSAEE